MLTPDLFQEITRLADLLRAKFTPSEFIPGCEVMDITDLSQYAANNGWVEAICGQHNQQRVRWKSAEPVIVGDFIDVIYFPDRRLFEAWGIGGAGAIAEAGILKSLIDDKGDLIAGTADDTPAILPVSGNDGWVLTEDSGEATGLKWAAVSGGSGGASVKNLLYHSLTHSLWREGATFNDIADDTYVADLWTVLHNGQAPDVTGQVNGVGDPYNMAFRCAFDSASSQAGIVQFLQYRDTYPLMGNPVVSLSFDALGSGVSNLRAAVIAWSGVPDQLTSDVVATWGAGNPTLQTNWAYANTPASSIAITSTLTRYTVENITLPSNTDNAAVFIWTPDLEGSGDLFYIANVQLERGPVATEFVARDEQEEKDKCLQFIYVLDASSNVVNLFQGTKIATTLINIMIPHLVSMRVAPTLTHNISGYLANTPTTTLAALINYAANNFFAITGALTVSLSSANTTHSSVSFTAGTSWDGTAGNLATLRIGPGCVVTLSSRL